MSVVLADLSRRRPTDPTYGWSVWIYPDQTRPRPKLFRTGLCRTLEPCAPVKTVAEGILSPPPIRNNLKSSYKCSALSIVPMRVLTPALPFSERCGRRTKSILPSFLLGHFSTESDCLSGESLCIRYACRLSWPSTAQSDSKVTSNITVCSCGHHQNLWF